MNKIDLKQKLETREQIDTYVDTLTNSIISATKEAVPLADGKIRDQYVSNVTKKLIEEKHKAYRKWRKTSTEMEKKHYYKTRELLSNSIRNDRIERSTTLVSILSAKKMQSAKVWNTVKKFYNKRINDPIRANLYIKIQQQIMIKKKPIYLQDILKMKYL